MACATLLGVYASLLFSPCFDWSIVSIGKRTGTLKETNCDGCFLRAFMKPSFLIQRKAGPIDEKALDVCRTRWVTLFAYSGLVLFILGS